MAETTSNRPNTPTASSQTAVPASVPSSSQVSTPVRAPRGKKKRLLVTKGVAHVQASYNNTIVTLTDQQGNVISTGSAGQAGFRGPKKSTPYAASIIVKTIVEKAKTFGLREVDVQVKGIGSGRESAIRALGTFGLTIHTIQDITPIPHNGCRRPKPRRV